MLVEADKWTVLSAKPVTGPKPSLEKGLDSLDIKHGTIIVGKKDGSPVFISGAHDPDMYGAKIGSHVDYKHDMNMSPKKGTVEIENVLHVKDGKIEHKINDIGLSDKRSWYVFK